MEKKRNLVWIIGIITVIVTTLMNLGPYAIISNTPFWMIGLMLDHPVVYYALAGILMLPIGTVVSSVVGNNTTGFLTFVLSSVVYVINGDVPNLASSFLVTVVCCLIYDNSKLPKWVRMVVSVILIDAFVTVVGGILGSNLTYRSGIIGISLFVLLYSAVLFVICSLLERLPVLKHFDEKTKDLDRNYRVHSLNRRLIVVINIICIVLVTIFSILSIVFLANKEKERKTAEEEVWEVVLYNALRDDADLFAERDPEVMKEEAEKIRYAFEGGHILVPANVGITTCVEGTYYQQIYEVDWAPADSDNTYQVEWLGEAVLEITDPEQTRFLPQEGNSTLTVTERSELKESAKDAVGRILSVALLLMVLMNVVVTKYIRKHIVKPINRMTTEAMEFAFTERIIPEDGEEIGEIIPIAARPERVEINSGDEIESLSRAFHKTMDDVEAYVEDVRKKSKELSDMQHNIIITMADIIESRDLNTGGHIKRTALYVGIIARKLMKDGSYSDLLTEDYMDDMIVAAPLHDMGKIHVPDQILNKNGRLTDEEFAIMKSHAAVGKELLDVASESLGDFKYLIIAKQMAESHHEWWNGNGYPDKLAGEEIPLCARIMAVADVFDALVSKRCYKEPMDLDVAFGIIEKETGTHFDPVVGQAFLDCRPEVEETLRELTK